MGRVQIPRRSTSYRDRGEEVGEHGSLRWRWMLVECCCVIHISNLPLLAIKICKTEESEHVDLTKCLRDLGVLVVHKREVASYRDGRRDTGS